MKTSYKNIIIGFGKAGKTLAAFLAKQGETVALVERSSKMYGGTCINVACIPTKSLITQSEQKTPYSEAHKVKDKLTSTLREKNYNKLDGLKNVTIIDGEASFISKSELSIKTANGDYKVKTKRIFINTGTAPNMPPIKGIDGSRIYNSETFMELKGIPKHVAIVGGGFIGLEFAGMLLNFGSKVTLIDKSEEFLPKEDRDIAEAILKTLSEKGLQIISNAEVSEFVSEKEKVNVHYTSNNKKSIVSADAVLMATGRTPQTENLNLKAAGITTNKRGFIKVNSKLQTSALNVWALGDVNGGPQFTYISLDDFRIIQNQLTNGKYNSRAKRKPFATAVFLTPPYARIGLNEMEAKEKKITYKLFSMPAAAIPKAAVLKQKEGLLKALVNESNGKIIGCMLYCAEAHELINIVKLAMDQGITYDKLRDQIYTHPTMAEAFNELLQES